MANAPGSNASKTGTPDSTGKAAAGDAISIVQRGNLRALENTLRKAGR